VVIGRRCRDAAAAQARAVVAGWTVLDDVSARDRLERTDAVSEHFGYDWLRHRVADAR
jgi:2-keto-4-pentenoate hydratase/2-oxohepta-3-ene-1,7-dioic acid hydratase in catechol pathway